MNEQQCSLPERVAASCSLAAENLTCDSLYWALTKSIIVSTPAYWSLTDWALLYHSSPPFTSYSESMNERLTVWRSAWVARSSPSVCLPSVCPQQKLKNKRSRSVQTWYREWSWDILEVVWFWGWKTKVRVRVRVNSNTVSNSRSAF